MLPQQCVYLASDALAGRERADTMHEGKGNKITARVQREVDNGGKSRLLFWIRRWNLAVSDGACRWMGRGVQGRCVCGGELFGMKRQGRYTGVALADMTQHAEHV